MAHVLITMMIMPSRNTESLLNRVTCFLELDVVVVKAQVKVAMNLKQAWVAEGVVLHQAIVEELVEEGTLMMRVVVEVAPNPVV